jgi:hypothetical protein
MVGRLKLYLWGVLYLLNLLSGGAVVAAVCLLPTASIFLYRIRFEKHIENGTELWWIYLAFLPVLAIPFLIVVKIEAFLYRKRKQSFLIDKL